MAKMKKVLLMLLKGGNSQGEVAAVLHVSKRDVSEAAKAIREHNLTYEEILGMDPAAVEDKLFPKGSRGRKKNDAYLQPDMGLYVERKKKRHKLLVKQFWQEYCSAALAQGKLAYSYQSFCEQFSAEAERLGATRHFRHTPGEKAYIDWAGDVAKLTDKITGRTTRVYVLVVVLPFSGLFAMGVLPLLTAVITFAMCDCFDTVGTLLGTAGASGMLDKDGNLPGGDRALIADAAATCVGALLGTSTVTTFVESSTGISEGARTGLSSVVTGLLFLLACVLAPIAGIIPSAATAPALIIVGMFMIGNVAKIDWKDPEVALPCFLTIAMMPFAYSISDGIGFGIISYTVIKVCRGKVKEVPVLMYVLSVLFVAMYVLSAL